MEIKMDKTYEERRQNIINKNNIRRQEIYNKLESFNNILRKNGYIKRLKENKEGENCWDWVGL